MDLEKGRHTNDFVHADVPMSYNLWHAPVKALNPWSVLCLLLYVRWRRKVLLHSLVRKLAVDHVPSTNKRAGCKQVHHNIFHKRLGFECILIFKGLRNAGCDIAS